MTNIVNRINEYILENILKDSGIDVIYTDLFPESEGTCLMSRHDPSQAKTRSFIDGTDTGTLQVAYYMRDSDPAVCRTVLNEIITKIDDVHLETEDASLDISAQTLPSFVEMDDKELTIYTAELSIDYVI